MLKCRFEGTGVRELFSKTDLKRSLAVLSTWPQAKSGATIAKAAKVSNRFFTTIWTSGPVRGPWPRLALLTLIN